MQEDIGKKKKALRTAILLTIALVVFVILNFDVMYYAYHTPQNIYDSEFDIIKHGASGPVEAQINKILGYHVVKKYKTYDDDYGKSETIKKYYFYIPVSGGNNEIYYICVKVDESSFSEYDEIYLYTKFSSILGKDIVASKAPYIKGLMNNLSEDSYRRMKSNFRDLGIFETESQLEKYVLPYVIEYVNFRMAPLLMAICIALLILSIISWRIYYVTEPDIERKIICVQLQDNQLVNNNKNHNMNLDEIISINGVEHKKKYFTHIDSYICTNQDEMAIEELCRILGVTNAEAKDIVENWFEYYQR